jgi:hypothetical protein
MPKIATAKSSEEEMSAATQVLKVTVKKTRNSGRTVSTAAVIAASGAGSSKRTTGKTNQSSAAKVVTEETVSRNKEAIQASIETLEERTMHKSWYDVLSPEFTKPYFKKVCLSHFLRTHFGLPTVLSSV